MNHSVCAQTWVPLKITIGMKEESHKKNAKYNSIYMKFKVRQNYIFFRNIYICGKRAKKRK